MGTARARGLAPHGCVACRGRPIFVRTERKEEYVMSVPVATAIDTGADSTSAQYVRTQFHWTHHWSTVGRFVKSLGTHVTACSPGGGKAGVADGKWVVTSFVKPEKRAREGDAQHM